MEVITRFAPSPTGKLHLGSIRTALYSWLFAKRFNGKFILRIENTDQKRIDQESVNSIINSMQWLGLNWDSGPYFQTSKIANYRAIIKNMIDSGLAYPCYCSQERLNNLRSVQIKTGKKPKYDRHCRLLKNKCIKNKNYVIRFANPEIGYVTFYDLIRGKIIFQNSELDDLIILRSNGIPTYNFCAVIDDHEMNITHVIRGEDHLNNTPRQLNIFKALKLIPPKYAHISMILDENKRKLSKKNQDTDILQYKDDGILPEALLNYLVRLGWSCGNQEIFNIDEMKNLFDIKSINKANCIFNKSKLLWINQYYISNIPTSNILTKIIEYFKTYNIDTKHGPNLEKIVNLFKSRSKTLKEIFNQIVYFYRDIYKIEINLLSKYLLINQKFILELIYKNLKIIQVWSTKDIKNIILKTAQKTNTNMKNVAMPLRIILSGRENTPSIDILIYTCGKIYTLKKIKIALQFITNK
ncbi:glutamyl-tRNA synthetase [Wigglesworthia glossinidia endosymbiont of Glossina morsitans morsitans (Yale colony)]|uniref:Glutamate--tRNA ligase n=1 Tax=Wigglesworthia glossinidia endosymbiont of Glossina morsitans morsitans (Yale colony) TaxID=1142511 RepID=H6Q5I7_WIGGL|nr:glutamate--tRNA ligase [Wigglesworthia glossinidia]AFA41470.1 glutamyl-tRNA synthetase [Wigglesworthia glossinidia endosymbiont of Glossina morsitans morsitans (Yale colony)]